MRRARPLVSLAFLPALFPSLVTAQGNWFSRAPALSPPVNSDHVVVAHPGGAYLFGGAAPNAGLQNETWLWNRSTWKKLLPTTSPAKRMRHAGAWDQARARFVMFGGSTALASGYMGDTWEFDGAKWTRFTPTTNPGPRGDHTMVYDPLRKRVLLHGGRNTTSGFDDTWAWNGKAWTKLTTVGSTGPRRDHALVFDTRRGRFVTHGGFSGTGLTVLSDTWEFDGVRWTKAAPKTSAGALVGYSMVYDVLRARCVLFSGWTGSVQPSATLEYDGKTWTRKTTTASPAGRSGHAMTYDFVQKRVLMFGGWTTAFSADTWEFYTTKVPSFGPFGGGCKGSAGIPALAAVSGSLPWIGDNFSAQVTLMPRGGVGVMFLGFSKTSWGGVISLPLKLGPVLGMTGCNLHVSPDLSVPYVANGSGLGTATGPVPNDPKIAGGKFHIQALVFDGSAAGGAVMSNGGTGTVGAR